MALVAIGRGMMMHVSFTWMLPAHCKSLIYSFSCRCKVRMSCFRPDASQFGPDLYNFFIVFLFLSPIFHDDQHLLFESQHHMLYENLMFSESKPEYGTMKCVITRIIVTVRSQKVSVYMCWFLIFVLLHHLESPSTSIRQVDSQISTNTTEKVGG